MFVYVVIAVILIINVINPRILWYIDSWKYRDAKKEEPSSLYLLLCRILSLLGLIILVMEWSESSCQFILFCTSFAILATGI